MSSIFLSIQTGIAAALTGATALAGAAVQLNTLRPIPEGVNTALVVRLGSTTGNEYVIGSLEWVTSYTVECYARVATGSDPAVSADALLVDVWSRLSNLDPASIGALSLILNPQIDWQYDDSATPLVCAVFKLQVEHVANLQTLTA
jgi:hypothetical protein